MIHRGKSNFTFFKHCFPMAFSPERAEERFQVVYPERKGGLSFPSLLGKHQAPLGCGEVFCFVPFFGSTQSGIFKFERFRIVRRSVE